MFYTEMISVMKNVTLQNVIEIKEIAKIYVQMIWCKQKNVMMPAENLKIGILRILNVGIAQKGALTKWLEMEYAIKSALLKIVKWIKEIAHFCANVIRKTLAMIVA